MLLNNNKNFTVHKNQLSVIQDEVCLREANESSLLTCILNESDAGSLETLRKCLQRSSA